MGNVPQMPTPVGKKPDLRILGEMAQTNLPYVKHGMGTTSYQNINYK